MNVTDTIDEIDWLLAVLKPGMELDDDHRASLAVADITCSCRVISRGTYECLIDMLKHKRESLE